jgi:flavorubredoxin
VTTDVHEIAEDVYRVSTYVERANLVFNQFLIMAEQPLLWHCGHRQMFPAIVEAVERILPPQRLRWLSFGHVEADEMGAMNRWLAAAPAAEVVQGSTGVLVSVTDLADRIPRTLHDGEMLDLGGRRVRWIDTPHVPHGWDAGLIYEEVTGTLFTGDLFTAYGQPTVSTDGDIVGPAIEAEDTSHSTAITPTTGPTVREMANWKPQTLALMHGPAFTGDAAGALQALGDDYERRMTAQISGNE